MKKDKIMRNEAPMSTINLSSTHPLTNSSTHLLTGRENVYFNGAILGMTKQEIVDKFDEIVKFA